MDVSLSAVRAELDAGVMGASRRHADPNAAAVVAHQTLKEVVDDNDGAGAKPALKVLFSEMVVVCQHGDSGVRPRTDGVDRELVEGGAWDLVDLPADAGDTGDVFGGGGLDWPAKGNVKGGLGEHGPDTVDEARGANPAVGESEAGLVGEAVGGELDEGGRFGNRAESCSVGVGVGGVNDKLEDHSGVERELCAENFFHVGIMDAKLHGGGGEATNKGGGDRDRGCALGNWCA
jgi:hypothetical protein